MAGDPISPLPTDIPSFDIDPIIIPCVFPTIIPNVEFPPITDMPPFDITITNIPTVNLPTIQRPNLPPLNLSFNLPPIKLTFQLPTIDFHTIDIQPQLQPEEEHFLNNEGLEGSFRKLLHSENNPPHEDAFAGDYIQTWRGEEFEIAPDPPLSDHEYFQSIFNVQPQNYPSPDLDAPSALQSYMGLGLGGSILNTWNATGGVGVDAGMLALEDQNAVNDELLAEDSEFFDLLKSEEVFGPLYYDEALGQAQDVFNFEDVFDDDLDEVGAQRGSKRRKVDGDGA